MQNRSNTRTEPAVPRQSPVIPAPIDDNDQFSSDRAAPTLQIPDLHASSGPLASEADLPSNPGFRPFFTLIEDPTTGEYHRPTVHYIFADDDPEILTSAALETFATAPPSSVTPRPDEVEERFVIVDVAADGKTIAATTSLSLEWQGVETCSTQAPSWGSEDRGLDRGWMLRISGQEVSREHVGRARAMRGDAEVDALIQSFDQRLGNLDRVLGSAQTQTLPRESIVRRYDYEKTDP